MCYKAQKCSASIFFPPLLLVSCLFQLSWLEVLSGATAQPVTVTGLNYHVQTSTPHLDTKTQLICHTDPLIEKMN